MAYQLYHIKDNVSENVADCVYDFNHMLDPPFDEPEDGDWHSLDDAIEDELFKLGYKIVEVANRE